MATERLRLSDLAPPTKIIEYPYQDEILEIKVSGELPLPVLLHLLRMEDELNEDATNEDIARVFDDAYSMTMELLRAYDQDLPDLPLSMEDVFKIVSFLAGADSIAEAFAAALQAAKGDDAAPLGGNRATRRSRSPRQSSKASTRSPSASSGKRGTGKRSASASTDRGSRTRAA